MEFKKLSTVETTETVSDIANVLIEENGTIKKTPKTMFKGAETTTNEPDLVIRINTIPISASLSNISITLGSIGQVYEKVSQNIMPNVKIECCASSSGYYSMAQFDGIIGTYGSHIYVTFWAPPELNFGSENELERWDITFSSEGIVVYFSGSVAPT